MPLVSLAYMLTIFRFTVRLEGEMGKEYSSNWERTEYRSVERKQAQKRVLKDHGVFTWFLELECDGMDRINLAQDRHHSKVPVGIAMSLYIP
jgi:hypothetical protein